MDLSVFSWRHTWHFPALQGMVKGEIISMWIKKRDATRNGGREIILAIQIERWTDKKELIGH